MARPIDWSNTFDSTAAPGCFWGHISDAAEAARRRGLPYLAWNGRVYLIENVLDLSMLGECPPSGPNPFLDRDMPTAGEIAEDRARREEYDRERRLKAEAPGMLDFLKQVVQFDEVNRKSRSHREPETPDIWLKLLAIQAGEIIGRIEGEPRQTED